MATTTSIYESPFETAHHDEWIFEAEAAGPPLGSDAAAVTLEHKQALAGAFFETLMQDYSPGWVVNVVLWGLSAVLSVLVRREKARLPDDDWGMDAE